MQDIIDAVRQLPTRSEWRAGLDSILAALAPITRAAVPKRPRHRASIAPRIWHQGRPRPSTQKFAYRRRDDGEFRIPRRHLTFELRNIGGITEEPLTKAQGASKHRHGAPRNARLPGARHLERRSRQPVRARRRLTSSPCA
jgi:hypothetical protein